MILIIVFNVFFGYLFFGRSQEQARNVSPSEADSKLGVVTSEVERSELAVPESEPAPEPVPGPTKVEITTEPIYLPVEEKPVRKANPLPGPRPRAKVSRAEAPKPVRRPQVVRKHRPHPTKVASRKVRPVQFVDLMTERFGGAGNYEGINNRFGRNN